MGGPAGFERWLADVTPESFESGASIAPDWQGWLRSLYDELGPLDREGLEQHAEVAIDAVLTAQPWKRLQADFYTTTGRELSLDVYRADEGEWLYCDLAVDGRNMGGFSVSASPDAEHLIADIADKAREHSLDEEVWGGWPICPTHGTHPMETGVGADGRATWFCPSTGTVAIIGSLMRS